MSECAGAYRTVVVGTDRSESSLPTEHHDRGLAQAQDALRDDAYRGRDVLIVHTTG